MSNNIEKHLRTLFEIPAGKIDLGEEPKITAIRELEEETGYGAKEFTYIQSFATSPGFADEIIHLYLARAIYDRKAGSRG